MTAPTANDLLRAARLHLASGEQEAAIRALREVIRLQPTLGAAHVALGGVLAARAEFAPAIAALTIATRLEPARLAWRLKLAGVLADSGNLDAALDLARTTRARAPGDAASHAGLAFFLAAAGRSDEALAAYQEATAVAPASQEAHSALIFFQHLHPGCDAAALCAEARRWGDRHAAPLAPTISLHANDRDPERLLRIGYVSPDLRMHAASYFIRALWAHHDRARYHVTAYANVAAPDSTTRRLRERVETWRDIVSLSDSEAAELVREDRIDVLVDLAQHVSHNRLLVFARKPAPVQAAWIGLLSTTGLVTIDYLILDPHLMLPGADWCREEPWPLPETWCCYEPGDVDAPVAPLPAAQSGHLTFGALNRFNKVNDAVLGLWARVLRSIDGARLLLQCPAGSTRVRVTEFFARHGIDAARLEFVPPLPRIEYFRLHNRIDIALDPFPHNGHTTTCDALWMGVPVLTLAGRTLAGRAGVSLLTNAGLPGWIARDRDAYVALAKKFSGDLPALAALRSGLRAQLERSPVMDGPRFARLMEDAYRAMWRRWCRGESPRPRI